MSKFQLLIFGIINILSLQAHAVDINFNESTGVGFGDDRVQIYKIRVDTEIVNPFDSSRPQIYSVYYDVPFRFDPTTLHLVPDLTGAVVTGGGDDPNQLCASLLVAVNNAFDGNPIGNTYITVGEQTLTTNESGYANFTGLPAGITTIKASMTDFSADQVTKELVCGDNTMGIALNPIVGIGTMTTNQIRIVLTWGENPIDLDAHLTGPQLGLTATDSNETERFHVYWPDDYRVSSDGAANLDVDDTDSYGPETITISPPSGASNLRPGIYRYSVQHYAGSGNLSGARVKLILSDTDTRSFTPDPNKLTGSFITTFEDGTSMWGDIWTVFELNISDSGQVSVLPVDSYYLEGPRSVRSGEHNYGEAESVRIMRYHKK